MITVLVGENDYELTKKVAQLKEGFSGAAERYDAADLTREQLADIFAGQTLFALQRMIIIDTPSANPELWQHISTWAERLSEDTQLILVEPKPDKRTAAFKWFKKHANVQEFPVLDTRDVRALTRWVENYGQQAGLALTNAQVHRLAARVGANQWELAHAVDKLALADEVNDEWIDAVSQASASENVFALFETILNGDTTRLHDTLAILRQTEDPYRMLGLISSQALQLAALVYGDGNVAKVTSDTGASSSYPFQKLTPFAIRLSKQQVRDMIAVLADTDIRLKSSDADPWMVFENTTVRMASLAQR